MKRALALITVALGSVATVGTVSTVATAAQSPAVVDDAQVELAKLGVTLFSLDHLTEPATECPAVRADEVGFWMGQLGMTGTSQGYSVDAFAPDDVEALAIFCGVNPNDFVQTPDPAAPYALGLEVYSLLEGATFAQLLTTMSSPVTPTPTPDPALGGEVATWCGTPGQVVCLSFWHRNGLVLDVLLVGPAELNETTAQQLLLSMVDNAVTNLAAYGGSSGTATTVAPVTPTVAPTVPVPTVAPVTPTIAPVTPTVAPVPTAVPVPTVPVPTVAPVTPTVAPVTPTVAPVPTVPASTVPVLTASTVPGAPTTLPAGFARVSDDSGTISVALPSTWIDVETAGLPLDDGTTTPQLRASTDLTTFETSFSVPGFTIITAAPIPDPQTFLTSSGLSGGCTSLSTEPYDDGVFVGFVQIGTSCGASGTWRMIVGNTVDGATGVVIQLQTASPADQVAVDTALSTLVLS
jgi:hypothetical protein